MKQFPKTEIFSLFSLLFGIIGLALQRWLFSTADAAGLLLHGHISEILSVILLALVIAANGFFLKTVKPAGEYTQLFRPSPIAAGGCFFAAAGFLLSTFTMKTNGILLILVYGLCVLSASALGFIGYCRLRGWQPDSLISAAIAVFLIFRTLAACQKWSADVQIQTYFFPLLACLFLLLAAYYRAELGVGNSNFRHYLFFRNLALFCCLLSMARGDWLFYLSGAVWMATDLCAPEYYGKYADRVSAPMYLPKTVQTCMQMLQQAGFDAYAVGGCVRDSLLDLDPHDYDLCTNALPEETAAVFADYTLVRSGEKHGTIGVVMDEEVIEITTFRTEGGYQDSRHPDWVKFVSNIEEDLSRRDFTVNAMAYCPEKGHIDPFGGREDLENGILRTVGDPEQRFSEDALRILRGVRFAVRFRLTPEENTLAAMKKLAPSMGKLAKERVFEELCKLLPLVTAEDLQTYRDILIQVVPPLAPCVDFDQHTPHHRYDVYTHTAHVVEAVPRELTLRWAALLHDCGKPSAFFLDKAGKGHFHGHAKISAEMANALLLELKAPTLLREQVVFLIDRHMTQLVPDKKLLRKWLGKYGERAMFQWLSLQQADFEGKGTEEDEGVFAQIREQLEELLEEGACLTVGDLQVDGHDLLDLGFPAGKDLGNCLSFLLEQVQDELLPNEKEALLSAAKEFLQNKTDL